MGSEAKHFMYVTCFLTAHCILLVFPGFSPKKGFCQVFLLTDAVIGGQRAFLFQQLHEKKKQIQRKSFQYVTRKKKERKETLSQTMLIKDFWHNKTSENMKKK